LHYYSAFFATPTIIFKEGKMDHHSLRLFLHLAESLHFGRTGQSCHISPSALSRQIQRMEAEVGRRLFERDNRQVKLTRAGLVFRDYAKDALERWQSVLDELADEKQILKGEVTIYCSVTASLTILPDLLSAFKTAYPLVNIRLQTGDAGVAIRKVIDGEVDVAVAPRPQQPYPSLAFKVLTQVSIEFIAPRVVWEYTRALQEKPIPWEAIPMILSERGIARKKIDAWFRRKNIKPRIYAHVSGNEAILSMVTLGCGVGVVPELVVENSPLKGRITRLQVKPVLAPYDVGICIQQRRMNSRLIQAFWEIDAPPVETAK
jgi:LysR family positive regulator for ilvC